MANLQQIPVSIDTDKVANFCQQRRISRLSLFGSALRSDFDPDSSDLDILAEFEPGALDQVGIEFFEWGNELSDILGHRVDFCSKLHPRIRDQVNATAIPLYEQA